MKKSIAVNEQFRQWTRGLSFTLTMGKCQVAVLVCIAESVGLTNTVGFNHRLLRNWVTGTRGLQDRGLMVWHDPRKKRRPDLKTEEIWEITEAGWRVVELFKVAGIYQEVATEFHSFEKSRLRRVA